MADKSSQTPPAEGWEDLWAALANCAKTPFPPGWPSDEIVLFAPEDDVHKAITLILKSCQVSYFGNHYGFTDKEAIADIGDILRNPKIAAMLCLDLSQSRGPAEKAALDAEGIHNFDGTSVAYGNSSHGKISHLKVNVVDGWLTASGSTNLSLSGEQQQDNELRISRNPLIAHLYAAKVMLDHNVMLAQMRKKGSHDATSEGTSGAK